MAQIEWGRRFDGWHHLCPSAAIDTKAMPVTRSICDEPWDLVNKRREGKHPMVLFQFVTSFSGEFVHVSGPYKGTAADVTVARDSVFDLLKPGERLLADAGYRAEAEGHCIVAPGGRSVAMSAEDRKFAGEVHSARQIVERALKRLHDFAFTHNTWRYDAKFMHECVLVACKLCNVYLHYHPLN